MKKKKNLYIYIHKQNLATASEEKRTAPSLDCYDEPVVVWLHIFVTSIARLRDFLSTVAV